MIEHELILPKSRSASDKDPFAKPRLIYVYGAKGSGKTTLVMNLLMLIEKAQDIEEEDALMVSSNGRDPLLQALSFPITDSPEKLNDFMLMIRNNTDKKKRFLLILDDIQSSPSFKIMSGRSDFLNFVLSSRHFGVTIIVTAQSFNNSFSPVLKGNVDLWFLYQPKSIKENNAIQDFFDDSEKIKRSLKLLKLKNMENEKRGEPRTFLYINKTSSEDRYFIGFKDQITEF